MEITSVYETGEERGPGKGVVASQPWFLRIAWSIYALVVIVESRIYALNSDRHESGQ